VRVCMCIRACVWAFVHVW